MTLLLTSFDMRASPIRAQAQIRCRSCRYPIHIMMLGPAVDILSGLVRLRTEFQRLREITDKPFVLLFGFAVGPVADPDHDLTAQRPDQAPAF